MKTERKNDFIQLTVPETIRTNQRQNKAERYRTRAGMPTLRDIADATEVLNRLQTTDGVTELSQPENLDLLKWAHSIVNCCR